MSIPLSDNIKIGQQLPVDSRYLNGYDTWATAGNAITGIPIALRFKGLTVNVAGVEYWWKDGIADINLIIKSPDLPPTILSALPFSTDHLATTNNQYAISDVVYYLGNVYRCIANNDSIIPTNTLYWTNIGPGFPIVQQPIDWTSTSGNNQILNKPTITIPDLQQVTDGVGNNVTTNEITAAKLIKDGGQPQQFLKADGSVDNNTYLTSADLPSTLDLFATTSPDPVISGYTALVRTITDIRYDDPAVNVPTPTITGTVGSPTFCGAVISDPSILLGNPGVFNFSVIGKIRRTGGSTSSGADFFFRIYKRNLAGTETLIAESAPVIVPANGGVYIEYISIALWNDGIFLSTDRVVLKFYGIKTGGGGGATYQFLFGGSDPVRGTAAISSAIIPNIYLKDIADVEKVPALDNEVLYWNDADSLWEHSLAENLVPLATATQKGLVSIASQGFAGDKHFADKVGIGTVTPSSKLHIVGASGTGPDFPDIRSLVYVNNTFNNPLDIYNNPVGVYALVNGADIQQSAAIYGRNLGSGYGGYFIGKGYFSGDLKIDTATISTIASFDANKNIVSLDTGTYPSLDELKAVKGATTGVTIQSQLNGKQATLIWEGVGQNIKTVAGQTLLGTGNVSITTSFTTRQNANNSSNPNINYCGVALGQNTPIGNTAWTIKKLTISAAGVPVVTTTTVPVKWVDREAGTTIYS